MDNDTIMPSMPCEVIKICIHSLQLSKRPCIYM